MLRSFVFLHIKDIIRQKNTHVTIFRTYRSMMMMHTIRNTNKTMPPAADNVITSETNVHVLSFI